MTWARSGENTVPPMEVMAMAMPIMNPMFFLNHRPTTTGTISHRSHALAMPRAMPAP